MKSIASLALIFWLAAPAMAQRVGTPPRGPSRPPANRPGGMSPHRNQGPGLNGFVQANRGRFFNGGNLGYTWPYWGLGSWNTGMGYAAPLADPSPNFTVVYPPPAPQQVVSIYTEPPRPVIREYDFSNTEPAPEVSTGSPIYLIAFSGGTIRAASSYRVEGGVLRYVTIDGESKQAQMNTVDRPLSLRLNRERKVQFQIPE
jgi:hypothetical protein